MIASESIMEVFVAVKSITVNFVDFWEGFSLEGNPILQILRKNYDVHISNHPQYLFYAPYGNSHLKHMDCIRIFMTAENFSPDFNMCDYAMGFDYIEFGDRYLRRPNFYGRKKDLNLCLKKHIMQIPEKTEFCSFVVSNGKYADSKREEFFYKLSEYKKVNSGGRYLNNIGIPNGVPDKLEFQKKHKFALAFENTSHPGYTTEKIIDAFAASCIPIYWGDPWIDRVFNPKSFIDVRKFPSFDAAIQEIIRIDQDEEAYRAMLAEPAFLSSADYPDAMEEKVRAFLQNIIEQPLESAKRIPQGREDIWAMLKNRPKLSMNCATRFSLLFGQKKHDLGNRVRSILKKH